MRVISGLRKGYRLSAPKGLDVRPTEDKIKESLFNILGSIHGESMILDLFGGSGSIGIEFLSRGAKQCYFVDISSKSIAAIKDNLVHTKLMEAATVIKSGASKAIRDFYNKKLKFDYIFLDPPYRQGELLYDVLNVLKEYPILNHGALLIIEHESELVLEDDLYGFCKSDERKYGSKTITFYRHNNETRRQ